MFSHIYLNRIKASVRDRQMLFWTFLFPLILATLFKMSFSNLNANEVFQAIPIAVVNNEAYQADTTLQQVLQAVSSPNEQNPNEQPLFRLEELSDEKAAAALDEDRVVGYLVPGSTFGVVVSRSGVRQTILKSFCDDYLQKRAAIEQIILSNPDMLPALLEQTSQPFEVIEDKPVSSAEADTVLSYFYALIAMTCLYGGFWGLKEVIAIQANLSPQAARLNVAPVHKMKIFASSLLAALSIHYLSILILLAYLQFILSVNIGNHIAVILLATLSGSLLGVSLGGFIAAVTRLSEAIKNAMLIGVSMVCSFLSGLMIVDMKYITIRAFPALRYINPANLISDAFYTLYYYDTLDKVFLSIGLQLLMALLFFVTIAMIVRRQRYASL